MARTATSFVPNRERRLSPDELLGPLNAVERQNAPRWLWVEGDVSLLGAVPRVSVVGARTASPDGLRRAERLARELVAHEVVVVSGLARGVDTVAHETAIRAGGRTIAVLGTPVGQSYPRENFALQRAIAAEHLVVSQFAPGQPTLRTNFPQRNRTMALLSHATVIVEAGDSSGTLSQGWEALRLGRDLFIVKSLAQAPELSWPGEMLRYGAQILVSTEQVLEVLPPVMEGSLAELAF